MTLSPSEFRDEVEKLERKHAENPEGRYFVPLANAYRRSGDLRRAMSLLRQGLQKHPDYLSAHIVLGRCLADQGESGAAEAEFRYVLSLDPQNLIALRTLGELAVGQRNADDARKWYQELLSVDPMNEDARRALENIEINSAPPVERREAEPADTAPWDWPAPERLVADESGEIRDPAAFPESHESSFGTMIDLENTGGEGDALFGDEANAVVTETIAELYTRQGFYDRAADVYRELIRRRGGDATLEERLRLVSELAAGSAPADVSVASVDDTAYTPLGAPDPAPGVEVPDLGADPFATSFQDGFGSGELGGGNPESGLFSDSAYRPLTPSGFDAGFAAFDTPGLEVGFESGGSVIFAHGTTSDEPVADAAPAWAEPEQLPGRGESMTIRAYLNSVLSWTPGLEVEKQENLVAPSLDEDPFAADERADGAYALADDSLDIWAREGYVTDDVAPAGLESDALDREIEEALPLMGSPASEEADHAWLTGSGFVLEEETVPAPAANFEVMGNLPLASDLIDDELFPWELPASHPAVAKAVEAPLVPVFSDDLSLVESPFKVRDDPPDTHVTDSDAFAEVPKSVDPYGASFPGLDAEASPLPTTPLVPGESAGEEAPAESKEDDDLESFQTWLRSLKR